MTAAILVTVAAFAATLFRFRGVTGDLIPIVEFRFAAPRALPEAPPPSLSAAQPAPANAPSPSATMIEGVAKEAAAVLNAAQPMRAAAE